MFGVKVDFDFRHHRVLNEQWCSERVSSWLRVVILTIGSLYQEHGAKRITILRLLGNTQEEMERRNLYTYGKAADVSILDLPCVTSICYEKKENKIVRWICDRTNILFPFSDGILETARYGSKFDIYDRIHIEIPFLGFDNYALTCWHEWGTTGMTKMPRKIRLVGPPLEGDMRDE